MTISTSRQQAAALVGRTAMIVTCLYASVGMALQCVKIIKTHETPSVGMMCLGTLTFLVWTVYALVLQPRDFNILIPSVIGVIFSVVTLGLIASIGK